MLHTIDQQQQHINKYTNKDIIIFDWSMESINTYKGPITIPTIWSVYNPILRLFYNGGYCGIPLQFNLFKNLSNIITLELLFEQPPIFEKNSETQDNIYEPIGNCINLKNFTFGVSNRFNISNKFNFRMTNLDYLTKLIKLVSISFSGVYTLFNINALYALPELIDLKFSDCGDIKFEQKFIKPLKINKINNDIIAII